MRLAARPAGSIIAGGARRREMPRLGEEEEGSVLWARKTNHSKFLSSHHLVLEEIIASPLKKVFCLFILYYAKKMHPHNHKCQIQSYVLQLVLFVTELNILQISRLQDHIDLIYMYDVQVLRGIIYRIQEPKAKKHNVPVRLGQSASSSCCCCWAFPSQKYCCYSMEQPTPAG